MKRFLLGTIIILLAAYAASSQTNEPSAVPEAASERFGEAKRAIDKGNAQWIEAWENGDPEMLTAIFADDGVVLPRSGRLIKGHEEILQRENRPCKVSRARSRSP